MKPLLLALMLLVASPCLAFTPEGDAQVRVDWSKIEIGSRWTGYDTALMTGFLATRFLDWSQTSRIKDYPDLEEKNPMLGDHPSDGTVNAFFAATTAATIGLALILPRDWRRSLLAGFTLANAFVVYNNDQLGIKIGFRR